MRHYEVMIVLAPDLAEDGFNKQLERFRKIIEDGGGNIVNDDRWGIRSLAYPIRKYDQGYYTVFEWEGAPDLIAELDHHLRLEEHVLRHMVIHLDATAVEEQTRVREKRAAGPDEDEDRSFDDEDEDEDEPDEEDAGEREPVRDESDGDEEGEAEEAEEDE